jgi:hypothetical protein
MIQLRVKLTCDNDKCPDEATADALISVDVVTWQMAPTLELFFNGLELPSGWFEEHDKIYCSARCNPIVSAGIPDEERYGNPQDDGSNHS